MAELAIKSGIPANSIYASKGLLYHELPDTLPFEKNFTMMYQTTFLNEYFLSKERLLHVLPHQMKLLTEDEIAQKYNTYLPKDITSFDELLRFTNISRSELTVQECLDEN